MNQNLISIFVILFSLYLPNKLTEAKPIKEQKDILKKHKSEEKGNTPIKIVSTYLENSSKNEFTQNNS